MPESNIEQHSLYNYIREGFVLPIRLWLYRYTRRLLIIFILASIANFAFSYLFYTPKMYALRQENAEAVLRYEVLNSRIRTDLATLSEVRAREQAVYRSIFSEDTLDMPGLWQNYPQQKYEGLGYGRYAPLIQHTWMDMDALARQLYAESVSLDLIEKLAVEKDVMAECVPAIWPMDKRLLRGSIGAFGGRLDPQNRRPSRHEGIDLGGNRGTPIYATGTGVVQLPSERGYGYQVKISHGFGYHTRYAHLSRILVKPGQVVKRGEKIGEMGNTGYSFGTHLHYEVIYRGVPVNPINYLSRDMTAEEYKQILQRAKATTYESR